MIPISIRRLACAGIRKRGSLFPIELLRTSRFSASRQNFEPIATNAAIECSSRSGEERANGTENPSATNEQQSEPESIISEEFERKVLHWEEFLPLEKEAQYDREVTTEPNQWLAAQEFELVADQHTLEGRILTLKFCRQMSRKQFNRYRLLQTFIKEFLIMLPAINDSQFEGDLTKVAVEVVCTALTPSTIEVRLSRSSEENFTALKRFFHYNGHLTSGLLRLSVSDTNPAIDRCLNLLTKRKTWTKKRGFNLFQYAYDAKPLPQVEQEIEADFPWFNESQCEAIRAALNPDRPLIVIHGPPGTGKTKVIAQIVAKLVETNKKVVVCAPTHKAVFNLLKYCYEIGVKDYCQVKGMVNTEFTRDFNRLVEEHVNATGLQDTDDWRITQAADEAMRSVAHDSKVLFSTVTSGHMLKLLDSFQPDVVIVDEAGQVAEYEILNVLLEAPRLILVGDHCQLPHNVHSEEVKEAGLGESLLQYLSSKNKDELIYPLCVQHRFNSVIQKWPNEIFYKGRLEAHPTVANSRITDVYKLKDGYESKPGKLIEEPMVLVDTDLCTEEDIRVIMDEYNIRKEHSFSLFSSRALEPSTYNIGEALIAAYYLDTLRLGLEESEIGCITGYKAQVKLIQQMMLKLYGDDIDSGENTELRVSSVDTFQGQQREAIVMSFVKNNREFDLGFMLEYRRLNVAVTRAKRLNLSCENVTVSRNSSLKIRVSMADVSFKGSNPVFRPTIFATCHANFSITFYLAVERISFQTDITLCDTDALNRCVFPIDANTKEPIRKARVDLAFPF
ncbi:AAA domain-containing protein [Ditylenchus destructor]|uniref:AAA domain-containing protein n=1 Tax=Ditylenchus destructor TaxID=166010 RepID=A0AAD4QXX1_9BILA|nr:AAA domain-containing protein [Ditylenchus destructor]